MQREQLRALAKTELLYVFEIVVEPSPCLRSHLSGAEVAMGRSMLRRLASGHWSYARAMVITRERGLKIERDQFATILGSYKEL